MGGILWANSRRWRYLSQYYGEPKRIPRKKQSGQSAVLVGMGGYNSFNGILTIAIHKTGISLRPIVPFALFHRTLFISFDEINGWGTSWYLNRQSTELELAQAPDVKILMPSEQAAWINSHAGGEMMLSEQPHPAGKAGRGAFGFVVGAGVFMSVMLIWTVWSLIPLLTS